MANTPNFDLYKPHRADTNVEVDTSLSDNFTKIDTELKVNKDGLAGHISNPNAHTSENVSHADGSVKTTLDNHEERLGGLETDTEGLEVRVNDIETLGLDKLAPNLEGRIQTIESDVEGFLAPATFDAMDQQSYTFDEYRIGYVNNKVSDIATNVKTFEAKMDGIADDTVPFQNALDYLESIGGGSLLIPSGTLAFSRVFIPNNVVVKGVGASSILKLLDNCTYVNQRIPTGIYAKQNVDYFEIRDLTYDGNAENNVDVTNWATGDYNNYYAHGICNFWVNDLAELASIIPVNDFLISNVTIRNVIRDGLLFLNNTQQKGTVENVRLKNSYSDHLIYESNTKSTINYRNVTCEGFWHGAAIVADGGSFEGVKVINTANSPGLNFNTNTVIDLRATSTNKSKFKDVFIEIPFAELSAVINGGGNGVSVDGLTLTQTDTVLSGLYGMRVNLYLCKADKGVDIRNVHLKNLTHINVIGDSVGNTNDVKVQNLTIEYGTVRSASPYTDALLLLLNQHLGAMKNVHFSNVLVQGKSPSLVRLDNISAPDPSPTFENFLFENIKLTTDSVNTDFFDILKKNTALNYPTLINFKIKDSNLVGFKLIVNDLLQVMNVVFDNCYINGTPTKRTVLMTIPAGTTTKEIDFPYTLQPRTVTVKPNYIIGVTERPFVSFGALKMKFTYSVATTAYCDFWVEVNL